MTRYWLVCLLLGAMAWGQAASSTSAPAAQQPGAPPSAASTGAAPAGNPESKDAEASKVAPDAPVITINGSCENASLRIGIGVPPV